MYSNRGRRVIEISGFLICSKTPMELIFNTFGEFRWSPEGQIHSPHLLVGAPWISFKVCSAAKERVGCGKLPHLFIPCNLGSWACSGRPAFGQNCNLGSCICSDRSALEQNTLMMMMIMYQVGSDSQVAWNLCPAYVQTKTVIFWIPDIIYSRFNNYQIS